MQSLLNNLEGYEENYENKGEIFRYIRWQLKKMFYHEEKTLSLSPEQLTPKITRALIHQHDKLLAACQIVENCKDMQTCTKLRKFRELLKAHFDFEEKFVNHFIPKPNKSLSGAQKASNLGFYPLDELRKYNKKRMKALANLNMNERNSMKALNKVHFGKILRSLLRTQKVSSAKPPSN